jgi:hypothetical protein
LKLGLPLQYVTEPHTDHLVCPFSYILPSL